MFSVPVLGTLFQSLATEAEAQATDRTRFILYNHANSLQLQKVSESSWTPGGGFNLRGALAPLAPHASDLLVVERMYNNSSTYLHGNNSSAYSCATRGTGLGAAGGADKLVGGITIDQLIAQQISRPGENGVQTQSLILSNPIAPIGGDCSYGTIVGTADNVPAFPITNPLEAYERLFGVPSEDPALVARLTARRSQLDHLRQEIATVNATLPAEQRQSLDLYLTSIRALELDIARLLEGGGLTCEGPPEPNAATQNTRVNNPALWKTFLDLGVAALRCGMTRQLTLLHTYGCIHWTYEFDGERKNHHETVCHEEETGPFMTKILAWHAEQVAYLYSQLKESGQAEDTVILWMSDGGGQHHGGANKYPAILLGTPGRVLDTGKWVHYAEGDTALARFHLTLANAFGSPITSFGDGADPGTGPLTELLP